VLALPQVHRCLLSSLPSAPWVMNGVVDRADCRARAAGAVPLCVSDLLMYPSGSAVRKQD
jgi:hypothetical protein